MDHLLQIIFLLFFYNRYVKYIFKVQRSTLKRRKVEKLDKNQYNYR